MLYEPVQANVPAQAKENSKKTPPYDFTLLLKKLREKIKGIHVQAIGHGEIDGKSTLALLNVSVTFHPRD